MEALTEAFYQLYAALENYRIRLEESEREVEKLKVLTKNITPEKHEEHLWSYWHQRISTSTSSVYTRFCRHPSCKATEYCGTTTRPHKLRSSRYCGPDTCEICDYILK